jgi:hypothetical protein
MSLEDLTQIDGEISGENVSDKLREAVIRSLELLDQEMQPTLRESKVRAWLRGAL